MVKVKICGLTNLEDVLKTVELGADFIGFIFAESKRKINLEEAAEIIKNINVDIKKVGVFVNSLLERILTYKTGLGLDIIQLHGEETDSFCKELKSIVPIEIIKAFKVKDKSVIDEIKKYNNIDYVLLDSGEGGSGKTIDWPIAKEVKNNISLPLILSGGLTPENVKEAIQIVNPDIVDVSSGVEESIGKKDYQKLAKFISEAKK